jgi:P-type Mg2+ transporter
MAISRSSKARRYDRLLPATLISLNFIFSPRSTHFLRALRAFIRTRVIMLTDYTSDYWTHQPEELCALAGSGVLGLSSVEAQRRISRFGPNTLGEEDRVKTLRLVLRQFESPLVLVLIFGAALSVALGQWTDAAIIATIVLASAMLGMRQEYKASTALRELQQRISLNAKVQRDGQLRVIPASELAVGDVVELSAGNLVPADGVLLSAKDFLVTEAVLTGESMPIEKHPGVSAPDATLDQRSNCAFAGTSVRSGMATMLIMATGRQTQVGDIAGMIAAAEPETEFERGVRQFGYLLIRVMIVMVLFVLTVSQLLGRPIVESLLFAVALAVGMTPELLPAIVTVTLSAGARSMAKQGVIVRRLEALENLGSMDVLCTDKTGTLTEGAVSLAAATDIDGKERGDVLRLAYLNSAFETGIENPLDQAIVIAGKDRAIPLGGAVKIDEIPYDFLRKRLTIVVADSANAGKHRLITKGSFMNVLAACATAEANGRVLPLDEPLRQQLQQQMERNGEDGFRVLALAHREVPAKPRYGRGDEKNMTLCGFLLFADPPKQGAAEALANLAALGIRTKMISGDNRHVAIHVARKVGLPAEAILSGAEIALMKDEALRLKADQTDLFVEIDPQQKERIILALQKSGHAVGYLGDGINDAPALHAADVGISVDKAVDVARQSADIVLLRRDLDVLRVGVESGRRTFANTLKYISITTSANFGNMLSMALATPFLPFLPLLAKQILLNNFLSDLPSIAISTDHVDAEQARNAERWNVKEVRRFMIIFGLISSAFDLVTFALLLKAFSLDDGGFQTAWFVVSLLTEITVVLSLRTRMAAWRSRPSNTLLLSTIAVFVFAATIPYVPPVAALFGFEALTWPLLSALLGVVAAYILTTEAAKHWFYARGP